MKGYSVGNGYMGLVNGKYMLFESEEAYREYLLEKEIDVLEFICGFNQHAVSANFELALLYLQSNRLDDFYDTLLKCRNINGYDWVIESYIQSYEFYKKNCEEK